MVDLQGRLAEWLWRVTQAYAFRISYHDYSHGFIPRGFESHTSHFLLGYFWRITLLERAFWRWRLAREGFVVFFGRGHGTTLLLTWRNGF